MSKSDTIAKIAEALCKAQGMMPNAKEDTENPFFKSRYADLASVWAACRKPLADNGLSVTQLVGTSEAGVTVDTILMHSSGEWLSSSLTLRPTKDDPQGVGSAISYGRRYALAAIVGVSAGSEDDDGNAASAPQRDSRPPHSAARPASPAKPVETAGAKPQSQPAGESSGPSGPKNAGDLFTAIREEYNVTSPAFLLAMARITNGKVKNLPTLTAFGLLEAYRLFVKDQEGAKSRPANIAAEDESPFPEFYKVRI